MNWYQVRVMVVTHSAFALWGVGLYCVGFRKILGIHTLLAIALALAITGVYISLAMVLIR